MNRKRIQGAWAFYDWANSTYSLVISTAVFPIYFSSVSPERINLLGFQFDSGALYSYMLAFSFFLVALLSPFLSGIADYNGKKKSFLKFFCYLGASACAGLFFFTGNNIAYGLILSVLASVGFWGSLVFYNAFLPDIATPAEQDRLSARGFSLGYIGSSLLLIMILIMVTFPEALGLPNAGMASRIGFLMVGLWWAGFAQITFRRLPDNVYHRKPGERYIWKGFQEIAKVAKALQKVQAPRRFLYAFFFFSVGVQTIILLASLYGEEELKLDSSKLIATILLIQFVGIAGAYLFSFLSRKLGNLQALKVSVLIWLAVCVIAWALRPEDPLVEYKFYFTGALVGLVMGGIQAISRSTYSKLIPVEHSSASYFSFYDVSEKVAIIIGTFTYGFLIELTGSMRTSALTLGLFFLIGLIMLFRVPRGKEVY